MHYTVPNMDSEQFCEQQQGDTAGLTCCQSPTCSNEPRCFDIYFNCFYKTLKETFSYHNSPEYVCIQVDKWVLKSIKTVLISKLKNQLSQSSVLVVKRLKSISSQLQKWNDIDLCFSDSKYLDCFTFNCRFRLYIQLNRKCLLYVLTIQ